MTRLGKVGDASPIEDYIMYDVNIFEQPYKMFSSMDALIKKIGFEFSCKCKKGKQDCISFGLYLTWKGEICG
jgi:hypothetical protein